jgi:carbon monoxide dehydrogenase subunit G
MQLEFTVQRPLGQVLSFLANAEQFVRVHPAIYRCEHLGDQTYRFYETLRLGFIPLHLRYPVTISPNTDQNQVLMRANLLGIATIDILFALSPKESATFVQETITFKTFLPIPPFVNTIFANVHRQLFKNIEADGNG